MTTEAQQKIMFGEDREVEGDIFLKETRGLEWEQKRTKNFNIGHFRDNFQQEDALKSRILPQNLN